MLEELVIDSGSGKFKDWLKELKLMLGKEKPDSELVKLLRKAHNGNPFDFQNKLFEIEDYLKASKNNPLQERMKKVKQILGRDNA
ncbi:MAG: hypothetical protein Q7R70_07045 [Candidatus Diapherotrites archaeon]|nr:hypothetical protein [Candidatus Diapherotrites archaeon]